MQWRCCPNILRIRSSFVDAKVCEYYPQPYVALLPYRQPLAQSICKPYSSRANLDSTGSSQQDHGVPEHSAISSTSSRHVASDHAEVRRVSLSLLRLLLRECGYLPDAVARRHFKKLALSKFRSNRNILQTLNDRLAKPRLHALHLRAAKSIRFLQRANDGAMLHLNKMLLLAYGRKGIRKHLLLQPLLQPDLEPKEDVITRRLNELKIPEWVKKQVPKYTMALEALLKSQGLKPSTLKPQIPLENAWGRPVPLKRVKNITKKCYAKALDTALPPLPASEWESLRDLASGATEWEGPIERRPKRMTGGEGFQNAESLDRAVLQNALEIKNEPRPSRARQQRPHNLTKRHMRRMWLDIFQKCPRMSWNTTSNKWTVEWGSASSHSVRGRAREVKHNGQLLQLLAADPNHASENRLGGS